MLLVTLLVSLMVLSSVTTVISDCEKTASVATPGQKKELCDGSMGPGPRLCSVAAKRLLPFERNRKYLPRCGQCSTS